MSEPAIVVAYEDDHLVVVVKPSGIATTAPAGGASLTRALERKRRGALHPTSRLDAEVTGLVTYAKTKRAIAALREARAEGRYGRGYLALATSAPEPAEGVWEASIAIDPRDASKRVALPSGGSGQRVQHARTTYRVRACAEQGVALWLTPHTGRTHQLRVHAAHVGSPLLGDVRYGGPKRVVRPDGRVLGARRVMLHCAWLRLPRAEGGAPLELGCPVPADFADLWSSLGGDPAALEPTPPRGRDID